MVCLSVILTCGSSKGEERMAVGVVKSIYKPKYLYSLSIKNIGNKKAFQ